jgi:hypothetical protein
MAKSYRPYYPDEELLLPPSMRGWLPEKHLAYFVRDGVDSGRTNSLPHFSQRMREMRHPAFKITLGTVFGIAGDPHRHDHHRSHEAT